MPYTAPAFVTDAVIDQHTNFAQYPTELNKVMGDAGHYLENQVNTLSEQYSLNTGYSAAVLDTKFAAFNKSAGNVNNTYFEIPLLNSLNVKTGIGSTTFTRASTATYIDKFGILKVAAINEARFEKRGYLNEGSSINMFTYSEQFDATSWSKNFVSITPNTIEVLDPYGTNLADKLFNTADITTHSLFQSFTPVIGNTYTLSFFAKYGNHQYGFIRLNGNGFTNSQDVIFDLLNGTITSTSASARSKIQAIGDSGWYRISITATATTTNSCPAQIGFTESGSSVTYVAGNTADFIYIFGAQLETLGFASSYIPTASAAITRARDVLTVDVKNALTAGFDYSVAVDVDAIYPQELQTRGVLYMANSVNFANDRILMFHKYGTGSTGYLQSYNGNNTMPGLSTAPTDKYRMLMTSSGKGLNGKLYKDGVLQVAITGFGTNLSDTPNQFYIGAWASTSSDFFGHITNVRIWDRQLTSQEAAIA